LIEIDPSKKFERRGNLSYDATNQRIRMIDEVEVGSQRSFYDDILLYNEKIHYRVNLRTKVCNKTTIASPFRPIEVPSFANFTDSVYLGLSGFVGAGVLENIYQGNPPFGGRYSGSWTDYGCIPITDTYVSANTGVVLWSFYDVHPGIRNSSVFIPPSECQ
jgi:hypothetical protein